MKTQSNEKSVWVFCLIISALLAAIALADDRSARRTSPRGRSEQAPAARAENRPAPTAARPAPSSQPRTISRTARSAPPAAPSSRPAPTVPITPQRQAVPTARPVERSVVRAPSPGVSVSSPRSTAPVSRPVQRSVFRADTPASASVPQPVGRAEALRSVPAERSSVIRTPAASENSAIASGTTAWTDARSAQERPVRDRIVSPIDGRTTVRTPETDRSAAAPQGRTAAARSDGFVYRGSAWYQRSSQPAQTTTTERSASARARTVEPTRLSVDTIQARPQRVSVDQIDRRPERVTRRLPATTTETSTAVSATESRSRDRLGTRSDDGRRDSSRRLTTNSDTRITAATPSVRIDSDRSISRRSTVTSTTDGTFRTEGGRRSSHYPRSWRDSSSQIIVNGNNNVIVQGNVTSRHPRPYIPPRRVTNITYLHTSPYWISAGSGFVFHWSSLSCGRVAVVPYHDWYGVTYYYPRYHRRFMFVSLGGYWPSYRYVRYYWYGAHPYYWYGPNAVPSSYHTYNTYNTYNTYTTQAAPASGGATTYAVGGEYDFNAATDDFSDVRAKLAAEQAAVDAPYFETAADLTFAHAVKLFEAGSYDDAARQFLEAIQLSPDDSILPFTYAQALFAAGDYADAAGVLRAAMARIPADEPTVYYPRGLYDDDTTLEAQVAVLERAAAAAPDNADMHLLLGYHYLGLGRLDNAAEPLRRAAAEEANADAAAKLLDLTTRLQQERE